MKIKVKRNSRTACKNIARRTSILVQHTIQNGRMKDESVRIWHQVGLSGYGCTTVKYLGSSSDDGGIRRRFDVPTSASYELEAKE